ncbi:MAG: hypothetical protein AUH33_02340 [Chloroflexi bacterium 13_1_40CM_68_21]|nr:MAG: hypothetical protein AUH33_02340 [Chloroflexi bacterium 13_1_40CM_68_21]
MSVSIAVRSLVSIVVLPGVAAALTPWLFIDTPARPDGIAWLGLLPLGFGLALFTWCVVSSQRGVAGRSRPGTRRATSSRPDPIEWYGIRCT